MRAPSILLLPVLALVAACDRGREAPPAQAAADTATWDFAAAPYWAAEARLTAEELERGRADQSWQSVVQLDSIAGRPLPPHPEKWAQITPEAMDAGATALPVGSGAEGPTVFRIQILLDRSLFSPGMIDGRWGKNTAKAVYWLQKREGLPATARVDSATYTRLLQLAGQPKQTILRHRLTAADVEGPFIDLPEGDGDEIYEIAKLPCTCYETVEEKLTELFHVTPELLEKLNPGVALESVRAGQTIVVPNVRERPAGPAGKVARIEVSGRGSFVHAMDASGRILYHFPSTLGATYDPSPQGNFRVTSVTEKPWWHFQPAILEKVPDHKPEARIPPGPNNAVGMVWVDLSVPHYGIHGTKAPETIGYATSAGCVRLTNWDILFLSKKLPKGTPVVFRDTRAAGASGTSGSAERAASARPAPAAAGARDRSAPAGGSARERATPRAGASERGTAPRAGESGSRRDRPEPDTDTAGAAASQPRA